jgi:hypothetical protein
LGIRDQGIGPGLELGMKDPALHCEYIDLF